MGSSRQRSAPHCHSPPFLCILSSNRTVTLPLYSLCLSLTSPTGAGQTGRGGRTRGTHPGGGRDGAGASCTPFARTGEEGRRVRAGSHFFFVVGKEDVPGATALPVTHTEPSQRRQACEAERLGAEEGSRAGRGAGEAESEGGAVRPGAGGGKGRGSSRGLRGEARGWGEGCQAGWGGGGGREGVAPGSPWNQKEAGFIPDSSAPTSVLPRLLPIGFFPLKPGRDAYLPLALTSRGRLPPGCLK